MKNLILKYYQDLPTNIFLKCNSANKHDEHQLYEFQNHYHGLQFYQVRTSPAVRKHTDNIIIDFSITSVRNDLRT